MKNTCVDGTIPKLFEGKMLVSIIALNKFLVSLKSIDIEVLLMGTNNICYHEEIRKLFI